MESYLKISDEVSLRYAVDLVDKPKAIVLINHGFAEHLGRYDHVAKYFNESGFSVYRYDLRGHGRTDSPKGHLDSYLSFISDCNEMVKFVKDENIGVPVFMLGHSMGGLVTTMYGIAHPYELKGQILSGPAVAPLPPVRGRMGKVLNVVGKSFKKVNIRNVVEDDICSVPEVVTAYKNDPEVLHEATAGFMREFLIKAPDFVAKNVSRYRYPVLICHGEEDKVVPVEVGQWLYENISSKNKQLITYPNLYHEILNETMYPEILETMVEWMNIQLNK